MAEKPAHFDKRVERAARDRNRDEDCGHGIGERDGEQACGHHIFAGRDNDVADRFRAGIDECARPRLCAVRRQRCAPAK